MRKRWMLFSQSRGSISPTSRASLPPSRRKKLPGALIASGKRASPKNRIFLRYLDDMPKATVPAKSASPKFSGSGTAFIILSHGPGLCLQPTCFALGARDFKG